MTDRVPGIKYPEWTYRIEPQLREVIRNIYDNLSYDRGSLTLLTDKLGTPEQAAQNLLQQTLIATATGGGGGGGGGGGTGAIVIRVSTHAIRLSTYGTATDPVGSLFIETDRAAIYYVSNAMGVPQWVLAASSMMAAIASIPGDLGVNDTGFQFTATDAAELTEYEWTGTLWITTGGLREIITDAVTSTIVNVERLAHRSSGAAAAGFGARTLTELDNSANTLGDASSLDTEWVTSTASSETSSWAVRLRSAGAALSNYFQVRIASIRFRVGSFFGILTHANTADRTYNLPDATGNIPYATAVLTNNNFLFGGGTVLVKDAGFSVVPVANGGTGITYNRISDTLALLAQVAIIGSTNFANSGTVGTYRVSYSLETTTLDVTAGTIQLSVTYTDSAGAATVLSAALVLSVLGRTTGVFFLQLASGNVAYSTIVTGIFGTSQYALFACLERLS